MTPIVDAHHHLWDLSRRDYPWMASSGLDPIRHTYGLDELRTMTASTGVTSTVLVQTTGALDETVEFCATADASDGLIAGVIGWADLTAPERVTDVIAELRDGPGGNRLVGVRHQVQDEPDPDWLRRDDVRRSIAAIGSAGLVYDVLVRTHQLDATVVLVAELDDVVFVLDHAAKPPIAGDRHALAAWAEGLQTLARHPNVVCKLSGLVTETGRRFGADDGADELWPSFAVMLEAFGPDRLLYGSDWPVCLLAAEPADVLRLARNLTAELTEAERTAIFAGTARRIYDLERR